MIKIWESLDRAKNTNSKNSNWIMFKYLLKVMKFNGIVGRLLKKLFTGRPSSKKRNFKFPSLDKSDICERVNRLKYVLGIKENLECKLLSERTILIKRR